MALTFVAHRSSFIRRSGLTRAYSGRPLPPSGGRASPGARGRASDLPTRARASSSGPSSPATADEKRRSTAFSSGVKAASPSAPQRFRRSPEPSGIVCASLRCGDPAEHVQAFRAIALVAELVVQPEGLQQALGRERGLPLTQGNLAESAQRCRRQHLLAELSGQPEALLKGTLSRVKVANPHCRQAQRVGRGGNQVWVAERPAQGEAPLAQRLRLLVLPTVAGDHGEGVERRGSCPVVGGRLGHRERFLPNPLRAVELLLRRQSARELAQRKHGMAVVLELAEDAQRLLEDRDRSAIVGLDHRLVTRSPQRARPNRGGHSVRRREALRQQPPHLGQMTTRAPKALESGQSP